MTSQTWEQRFEEQFQESEMEDGWGNYSYVICTDKANLKNFIQSELSQQRKEIIEDVEKTVQKELETWARESIGAKAVESVQKALADIITKLSKPEV